MLIANNTRHRDSGHRHGVRLHRPAQRRWPEGRVRRLRQRGRPDTGRHLPGGHCNPSRRSPTLVSIGERVPGESRNDTFNNLGEGGAFDGRLVGFWGAWGEETKTVRLYCPTEGNKDRIAYCNQNLVCEGTGEILGAENSVCDDTTDPNYSPNPDDRICYQDKEVPVNQGIFVHDIDTRRTRIVAKTGAPIR